MKKIFISLACAVICCACDARHNNSTTDGQKDIQTEAVSDANNDQEGVADGQMAPDFTLNDIYGKPLVLSILRGKYVLIDFCGT
jgi:cytochrome oxidase Cu insertion factor (SCO1/SenC/PrrC family)